MLYDQASAERRGLLFHSPGSFCFLNLEIDISALNVESKFSELHEFELGQILQRYCGRNDQSVKNSASELQVIELHMVAILVFVMAVRAAAGIGSRAVGLSSAERLGSAEQRCDLAHYF